MTVMLISLVVSVAAAAVVLLVVFGARGRPRSRRALTLAPPLLCAMTAWVLRGNSFPGLSP